MVKLNPSGLFKDEIIHILGLDPPSRKLQEQLIRIAGLGKALQKMDPHLYPSGFKRLSGCWGPATVSVAE